ncbi:ThuA domain-containing protein [Echinicola sp. 20G]|uniref:ThuA domain-containing protein n=1 Tax=Echinicola sp. 20G TaxID=2781961 RepID=UPI001910C1D2|nr:ThuA domain-containing protein [Echinicola sp. 20G]
MKFITFLLFITILFSHHNAYSKNDQFTALIITERGDQHEGFVQEALKWIDYFSKKHSIAYKVINHAKEIDTINLKKFDVIIQLNYPPYTWTDKGKRRFEKYIDNGQGGWVGFHHATLLGEFDGYEMWNWFSDFMGGIRFKNYISQKASGTVHVEASNHPVMQGLPQSFDIADDEWYIFDKNPRPNVHVLANVDEDSYSPPSEIKMGDHPVIWENPHKKAKNIYFLIGHDKSLFSNEAFKKMFANAILWAIENNN